MTSPLQSYVLVFLQFLFIALLASPVQDFFSMTPPSLLGLLLIVDSAALAVWALVSMRRGTFHVLPEPLANAELTTQGPYKYIRHPMYTAALLAGLGAVITHSTLFHCFLLAALAVVLHVKIQREEAALQIRYSQYDIYRSRTKALIPFIY